MYIDKLDGKIGGDFYDKFAGEWREEQLRLQREIDRNEAAEQSYMDEGVQILELARNAQSLFERQEPRQKRRLLNFVLSNCTWEDGEVVATFRQLFDLLAKTAAAAARQETGNGTKSAKNEIWLCWQSRANPSPPNFPLRHPSARPWMSAPCSPPGVEPHRPRVQPRKRGVDEPSSIFTRFLGRIDKAAEVTGIGVVRRTG